MLRPPRSGRERLFRPNMLFTSLQWLVFLAAVFVAHHLAPRSLRKWLLLSSSVTFHLAERSHGAGRRRGTLAWLAITILLGLAFVTGQIAEYRHLYATGVVMNTNLFATTFFTPSATDAKSLPCTPISTSNVGEIL